MSSATGETMESSNLAAPTKACPFCSEDIKVDAKKCRHCGETVDVALRAAEDARRAADRQSPNVFMNAGGGGASSSSAAASSSGSGAILKPQGSTFWFIFWILVFWPAAIVYRMQRSW
jgi:glutaredoxin